MSSFFVEFIVFFQGLDPYTVARVHPKHWMRIYMSYHLTAVSLGLNL